jgi:hypothetical protein
LICLDLQEFKNLIQHKGIQAIPRAHNKEQDKDQAQVKDRQLLQIKKEEIQLIKIEIHLLHL